jgi:predicted CXXCH cytochrome family protein
MFGSKNCLAVKTHNKRKGKTMKKILLTAALVLTASSAFAFQPGVATNGITGTAHDLSGLLSATATQKCVFCHTPHNPNRNVPLWNRNDVTGSFSMYNSPSLSSAGKGAALNLNSVSAFCMSCHDGATALGSVKNDANLAVKSITTVITSAANLSRDLTNDHPIGFSYNNAYGEDTVGTKEARLFAPAVVATKMNLTNPPFFGTNGDQMECASCHKVHDDRIAPFLRYTNNNSALCMACHVK